MDFRRQSHLQPRDIGTGLPGDVASLCPGAIVAAVFAALPANAGVKLSDASSTKIVVEDGTTPVAGRCMPLRVGPGTTPGRINLLEQR